MRIKQWVCLFFFIILPQWASAQTSLGKDLDQLIEKVELDARVGVVIEDLTHKKKRYSHYGQVYFSPASIVKVYTAVRALKELGPSFRYNTWLLTNADQIKGGLLQGDVFVKFSGDPSFTREDLHAMLKNLKSLGIKAIQGHVWIDDSALSAPVYPPGRVWDDLGYGYGAPITSVVINKNQWRLYISPAKRSGEKARLNYASWVKPMRIDNEVKTTPGWSQQCPITVYSLGPNHLRVGGCMPKPSKHFYRNLALTDPTAVVQSMLKQTLASLHLAYHGPIGIHSSPKDANVLVFHASKPLPALLATMLQDSENVYAESLVKRMSDTQDDSPHLSESLPRGRFRLSDGSGLSRYNRITPEQFEDILRYAYQHPKIYQILIDALARPGEEGTMKRRRALEGMGVHAKTGSMTSIQSLAGFIPGPSGETLAFVIMANDFVVSRKVLVALENSICKRIHDST